MKLIVGLGNPGEKYDLTRHNLGFMVLDHLLKDIAPSGKHEWESSEKLKSEIAHITWQPKGGEIEKILLAKPKTYMNNSGMAVSLLESFYKIAPDDIWVVYDELDLPLGSMKIRFGGAAAGHHGVESIMDHLGTDTFWRIRLGIGVVRNKEEIAQHDFSDAAKYVLGKFTNGQTKDMRELVKRGSEALQVALEKDIETAQNRFNTK